MKKLVLSLVAAAFVLASAAWSGKTADARPQYKAQFDKKYMTEGSAMSKALNGKSNCNVCHQGMMRKNRNALGMELAKILDAKDVKDEKKIVEALDKVAEKKSGGEDSATFGTLLKEGKWKTTPEEK